MPEARKVLEVVGRATGASFEFETALVGRLGHRRHRRPSAAVHARPLRAERRHPLRRGRRAQVGQPAAGEAPRAGAPRAAQGARPLRQPPARHVLPDAGGRLAAQALGRRGHGHHGDPRADGRSLLRRAARPGGVRRRRRAGDQHDGLHLARDRARGAGGLRRRHEAEEAPGVGGQGQRPGRLPALARGRDPRRRRTTRRWSSSTCSWTTAPWRWSRSRRTSTPS